MKRARSPELLELALLVPAAALVALSLARVLSHRVALAAMLGWVHPAWVALLVLSALAVLAAARAAWRGPGRSPEDPTAATAAANGRARPGPLFPLRAAFVAAVLGAVLFVVRFPAFERLWLELSAGLVGGAFGVALLAARRGGACVRALDFALFHLCLAVVLAEAGLRLTGRLTGSPLLAQPSAGPWRWLERQVLTPGSYWHGYPVNSDGHYDEEFVSPDPGQRVVATVGDSFSVGLVHHALHYTTVAEELTGLRIDNYGAPGIGPLEYFDLLRLVIAPRHPDQVVVSVFAGNDLSTHRPHGRELPAAATLIDRPNVLVWQLPRRALLGGGVLTGQAFRESDVAFADLDEFLAEYPWVLDPALEEPTFEPEIYLGMERDAARSLCISAQATGLLGALDRMRRTAGGIPLAVMIIPDEFQVEDALWDELVRLEPALRGAERDRPQRLITAGLEAAGIPCLDLLPVLRAVPPLEDGDRHLYHLRDTHFNARGNRVAGEALARFLQEELGL